MLNESEANKINKAFEKVEFDINGTPTGNFNSYDLKKTLIYTGCVAIAALVNYLLQNLGIFHLSQPISDVLTVLLSSVLIGLQKMYSNTQTLDIKETDDANLSGITNEGKTRSRRTSSTRKR